MKNLTFIFVVFLFILQTSLAQEVEKKNSKFRVKNKSTKVDVKKNKRIKVESKKVEFKKKYVGTREYEVIDSTPDTFKKFITYPYLSQLGGKINAEGIQGLAHSSTNWYWTTTRWTFTRNGYEERAYIYKTTGDNLESRVKSEGVPGKIWGMGWHHLSDLDFYKGHLYVPIEKGKYKVPDHSMPSLVMLYDEDLNFLGSSPLSFHKDGKDFYSGGAWCAINPTNGFLYVSRRSGNGSQSNYSILDVYNPVIDFNAEQGNSVFRLFYVHSVKLEFNHSWNAKTYIQGGVFSPDGLFYYVMDPKYKYDTHSQSGIHIFKIDDEIGKEISVNGYDNVGKKADHIREIYRLPSELEGLDFVSPDELIYSSLLMKRKGVNLNSLIENNQGITTGFVLLTHLFNITGAEDYINLYHYHLTKNIKNE